MSASLARAAALALGAALFGSAAGLAAAPGTAPGIQLAQGAAPPTRLGPRRAQPSPSQPEPAPAPEPRLTPPVTGPVPLILPEVHVQTLSEVDAASTGVLDDAHGGLGADMWRGADRDTVERLLALLPKRASSPTIRDLMRRLLLTRAAAPSPTGNSNAGDATLLAERVDALAAIGDFDDALKLIRTAPPDRTGESMVRSEVEALFFANDNAGACKEVRANAQGFQGVYWLQATAYCLALAGDNAKAALVSELLAERGTEVNPAFFVAMDAITGGRANSVPSLAEPTALHLSMLRAANLRLPDDVARSTSPAVLRAVALSPNADFALRLDAAEGAFAAGALPVEQLLEIYVNVPFEPGELSSPLSAAEAAWGPRGRALLMRAAALNDVPTARAEVLKRALQLGREKGGLPIVMAASAPMIADIEPAGELLWFARDAAGVLFAANRLQRALGWYALVGQEAAGNKAAAEAATALWPLAALAGDPGAVEGLQAGFNRWWASQPRNAASKARAQRLLTLLGANGVVVGSAPWAKVIGGESQADGAVPDAAIRHMIARATAERRRGEAVTLALIAFGDAGPSASTLALDLGLRALNAVGLATEARAIALEAAVAAGL